MAIPAMIHNYAGKKMGSFLTQVANDISPIQLAKASQAQSSDAYIRQSKNNFEDLKAVVGRKSNNHMSLKEYFSGKQLVRDDNYFNPEKRAELGAKRFKTVSDNQDASRAMARSIGAGTIAAYGTAPLVLGEDNPINRTVEAGAAFATHAGITAGALSYAGSNLKGSAGMFGVAYGGLAAINAIRSGNNFGPF